MSEDPVCVPNPMTLLVTLQLERVSHIISIIRHRAAMPRTLNTKV